MIVSKFNFSAPSTIQGIDFVGRAAKADPKELEPSNFADLLDANGPGTANVADSRRDQSNSVETPASRNPGEVGRGSVGGATANSAVERESGQASDDSGASGRLSALADEPPLIRDPRLEDPDELALEAAAVAIAASLVQKNQDPVLPSVSQDELQSELGVGGGENPSDSEGSLAPESAFSVTSAMQPNITRSAVFVPAEQGQIVHEAAVLVVSQETAEALRDNAIQQTAVQGSETEQPAARASVVANVVSTLVPVVVLSATPAEASALASRKADESFAAQTVLISRDSSTAETSVPQSVVGQTAEAGKSQGGVGTVFTVEVSRSSAQTVSQQSASDSEFLASAPPPNPSAAFFAARTESRSATESSRQEPENGLFGQAGSLAQSESVLLQSADSSSGQFGNGHSHADPGTPPEKLVRAQPKSASFINQDVDNESQTELGTFGAEDVFVQSERSPISIQTKQAVAAVKSAVEESSSSIALNSSADSQATSDLSRGNSSEVLQRPSSRPTVLPPVQTRMSELHNVLQNALERARSQNPSHLAVEIKLDDGSSFGLEVRMSSSGLQASFRSESQPLLRALESSWSGFLASESADQRVTSAVFEGRSGLGEFSQNGSGAGERRQQLEDGAAAAVLQGLDARGAVTEKGQTQEDVRLGGAGSEMALYA